MMAGADRPMPRLAAVVGFLALAGAPHVLRLPIWISLLALGAWSYVLLAPRKQWKLPSKSLLQGGTLGVLILVILTEGLEGGVSSGIPILAVLMALKPLEIRGHRDCMAAVMIGLFLVLSNLFFTEAPYMAAYLLLAAMAACMVFMHLARPQERPRVLARQAGVLLLQGLPFMLVLFFLFPRLPAGLFGLPSDEGRSGIDDTMTPGDVSNLVLDDALVFRAEFAGEELPARDQLYWRGLTLWRFDGRAWVVGGAMPVNRRPVTGNQSIEYAIVLEPKNTPWLYALDKPVHSPGLMPFRGRLMLDHTLRANNPVSQRMRYEVISIRLFQDWADHDVRQVALTLPPMGNPRARALGRQLARQYEDPEDRVRAMLLRFKDEEFVYTLQPPLLGQDSVDDFLFNSKQGFCEHYASAFAFTMRAAGVPTRVVMGYLGGQLNPVGRYISVRQAEAHAWTEVEIPGRGWIRVDPTAAVAPQRIVLGLEASLTVEDRNRFFQQGSSWLTDWPWFRNAWDNLSFQWYNLVLSYGALRQFQLLQQLGLNLYTFSGWVGVLLLAAALVVAGCLLVLFWQRRALRRGPASSGKLERLYTTFCRRMARAGLPRPPAMGPQDYAATIRAQRPDLSPAAEPILERYTALQFGHPADLPGDPRTALRELTQLVRRFKPSS